MSNPSTTLRVVALIQEELLQQQVHFSEGCATPS